MVASVANFFVNSQLYIMLLLLACMLLQVGPTTMLAQNCSLINNTSSQVGSLKPLIIDSKPSVSNCECGAAGAAKIVDGVEAAPHEFPWMAYLVIKKGDNSALCGGFLVSDRHVITAAHCTKGVSNGAVQLTMATNNPFRQVGSNDKSSVHLRSTSVVIHPDYDGEKNINDVSVITVDSPVTFSDSIRPVCLPTGNDAYAGRQGTIAGWGTLSEGGDSSNVLMKGTISILANSDPECQKTYGNSITAQMMCAGGNGTDTCQGDSGGPLMVSNNSIYTAVGIVSFGVGCGQPHTPGVYARLTELMPFIRKQISGGKMCQ